MQAAREPLSEESGQTATRRWSLATRIAFRFAFPYLVLYYLGTLLATTGLIVNVSGPADALWRTWRLLDSWVATHLFHLNPAVVLHGPTGSTDTALDYIQNLCIVLIAAAVALVWSGLDRRRPDYRTLHSWLRLVVRYPLLINLFVYGFGKVFPQQMAPPSMFLYKLLQPYGDKSPMGVLWSFIGSSPPYQIFSGAAEVTAAALLLFRRTTTLGALVAAGVLLNVVMLNFSYDVPVKLFSVNLLLAALFLAAPDLTKLGRFFVLNRSVDPPNTLGPVFPKSWARTAVVVLKFVFISFFLFQTIFGSYQSYRSRVVNRQRPELQGLYEVETFIQNGRDIPPLTTDSTRWRRIVIDFPTSLQVQMMDESFRHYGAQYDAAGDKVILFAGRDHVSELARGGQSGEGAGLRIAREPGNKKYEFACSRPDADHVVMQGTLINDSLTITMKRIDLSKFPLLSRRFQWIQESGFNP